MRNKGLITVLMLLFPVTFLSAADEVVLDSRDTSFLGLDAVTIHEGTLFFSHGDFRTAADYSGLEEIKGDLVLFNMEGSSVRELFPSLKRIDGNLLISGNDEIKHLVMPSLELVEGRMTLKDCPVLKEADFPALQAVGELLIEACDSLERLSLPLLAESGDITLAETPRLVTLELPVLIRCRDLAVTGPMTAVFAADSLESARSVQVENLTGRIAFPRLTGAADLGIDGFIPEGEGSSALDFPALSTLTGDLFLENSSCTVLRLSALASIGGRTVIRRNEALKTLSLPSLSAMGRDFSVWENPAMTRIYGGKVMTLGPENRAALRFVRNGKIRMSSNHSFLKALYASGWEGSLINERL